MRADIRDANILKELNPNAFESYLQARQWQRVDTIPGRASVWRPDAKRSSPEVIVPLKTDFADYALRVSEIIQTLARFEDRSQLEIIAELSVTQADVIRIRVNSAKQDSGTIALTDGVTLYEAARDMLTAAACATVRPKPLYQTRKPDEAMNYLDNVLIGPSEQGSFVAKIISPSPPRLETVQPSLDFDVAEPFERRVTATLNRALIEMQRAAREAERTALFDPFEDAVRSGVSANLCEAIHTLASLSADDDLHLRFSWSHARRDTKDLRESIRIDRHILPTLKEATRLFKERTPRDDFELEGLVTALRREEEDDAPGTVVVMGYVEGKTRKVRLSIRSKGDYDRAISAHRDTRPISVKGDLVREGRAYELRNPRNLELLDQED